MLDDNDIEKILSEIIPTESERDSQGRLVRIFEKLFALTQPEVRVFARKWIKIENLDENVRMPLSLFKTKREFDILIEQDGNVKFVGEVKILNNEKLGVEQAERGFYCYPSCELVFATNFVWFYWRKRGGDAQWERYAELKTVDCDLSTAEVLPIGYTTMRIATHLLEMMRTAIGLEILPPTIQKELQYEIEIEEIYQELHMIFRNSYLIENPLEQSLSNLWSQSHEYGADKIAVDFAAKIHPLLRFGNNTIIGFCIFAYIFDVGKRVFRYYIGYKESEEEPI